MEKKSSKMEIEDTTTSPLIFPHTTVDFRVSSRLHLRLWILRMERRKIHISKYRHRHRHHHCMRVVLVMLCIGQKSKPVHTRIASHRTLHKNGLLTTNASAKKNHLSRARLELAALGYLLETSSHI